jgi:hypothetical protein
MSATVRHLASKVAADPIYARLLTMAFALMVIVGPSVLSGGGPGG